MRVTAEISYITCPIIIQIEDRGALVGDGLCLRIGKIPYIVSASDGSGVQRKSCIRIGSTHAYLMLAIMYAVIAIINIQCLIRSTNCYGCIRQSF